MNADHALNERRQDKAFMDRIAHRVREDAALMERLRDGGCRSARLVESRDGGALLVYECECGARLTRTREQAEADAQPPGYPRDAKGGMTTELDWKDHAMPDTDAAKWRSYLPLDCPNCARHRLEYRTNDAGNVVQVKCEKCGFDTDDED